MMKFSHIGIFSVLAVLLVGGCATMPTGPSVMVLPPQGKPFEQFQADDAVCRQWAQQQLGVSPQETANQNTAQGAVIGTALGAGLGAAIGSASGAAGTGAAIGAASGLVMGTAAGASAGQSAGWQAQRRYDNAYVQCMYAKGNLVPGATAQPRRTRSTMTPPPPPDLSNAPQGSYAPYPAPPDMGGAPPGPYAPYPAPGPQ